MGTNNTAVAAMRLRSVDLVFILYNLVLTTLERQDNFATKKLTGMHSSTTKIKVPPCLFTVSLSTTQTPARSSR